MKYDLTKQGERWRALNDGHELISENGTVIKLVDGFAVNKKGSRYDLNANCWKLHTPEEEKLYAWIIWKPKDKKYAPWPTPYFYTEKEIKVIYPESKDFAHIRDREFPGQFE